MRFSTVKIVEGKCASKYCEVISAEKLSDLSDASLGLRSQGCNGDFPHGDLCGRGNIGCADYISMTEMTTLAAQKDSTNKTIAFVNMTTLRARPARVSRIDGNYWNAGQLRFVFNEPSEFGERPFRHPVPLSFPEPYSLADACQFFNSNAAIRVCGFLNDLLRDAVIGVRLESTLTSRKVSQFTPDILGPFTRSFLPGRFLLKGAARLSIVLPDFFDLVDGVDFAIAVSCDIHDPHVNADEVGFRYRHAGARPSRKAQ